MVIQKNAKQTYLKRFLIKKEIPLVLIIIIIFLKQKKKLINYCKLYFGFKNYEKVNVQTQ